MKELLKSVEALTAEELARSYEKFPKFNSSHEGYAVIKEEVEECQEDIGDIEFEIGKIWDFVKQNDTKYAREFAARLRESAIHAASEAVQVAAMA